MPTVTTRQRQLLSLNTTQAAVYFDVEPYSTFTIESVIISGTWATANVTVTRSAGGSVWAAMETALTLTIGGGTTVATDCIGISRLRVQVTTVEGGAGVAEITLLAKGDG